MVVVVGRGTCKYKKEEGQQQPRHCGADVPGAQPRANTKKEEQQQQPRHCGVDVPRPRANTKKKKNNNNPVIVVLMSPEREPSPGKVLCLAKPTSTKKV